MLARLPETAAKVKDLVAIEQEVAAFFGLGRISGIEYQIARQ